MMIRIGITLSLLLLFAGCHSPNVLVRVDLPEDRIASVEFSNNLVLTGVDSRKLAESETARQVFLFPGKHALRFHRRGDETKPDLIYIDAQAGKKYRIDMHLRQNNGNTDLRLSEIPGVNAKEEP